MNITQSPSVVPILFNKGLDYLSEYELASHFVDSAADITRKLIRLAYNPQLSITESVDLIAQVIFATPLTYLTRHSETLNEYSGYWTCYKTVKLFVGRYKRHQAGGRDLIELIVQLGKTITYINLKYQMIHKDGDYAICSGLNLFCSHVLRLLNRIPNKSYTEEIPPSLPQNPLEESVNAFIDDLNRLHIPKLSNEEQRMVLKKLQESGATPEGLIDLKTLPACLTPDKELGKYICAITSLPVRFPVIVSACGQLNLCDRAALERYYGPINNFLAASSRPHEPVPGLNCLPGEVIIIKRFEHQIFSKIQCRLKKLSTYLARYMQLPEPRIEKKYEECSYREKLGLYFAGMVNDHGTVMDNLAMEVDTVASMSFKDEGNIPNSIRSAAQGCVQVAFKATSLFAWMENFSIQRICVYVLGLGHNKFKEISINHIPKELPWKPQ